MRCDFFIRFFLSGVASHSCRSRIDQIARFAIQKSPFRLVRVPIITAIVKLPRYRPRGNILSMYQKNISNSIRKMLLAVTLGAALPVLGGALGATGACPTPVWR